VKPGSLRLRLVAGGAAAIVAALVIAGIGLTYLFERHVLRSLADDLDVHLRQALASIEIAPEGRAQLSREPSDPRFTEPLSGLYWQLSDANGVVARSRSLWDGALALPHDSIAAGDTHEHRVAGPNNSALLAVERTVSLQSNGAAMPVRIIVAAALARVAKARQAFAIDLILSLAMLAVVLAAATWVQIGLGLRPLARLREGIAAIRAGSAKTIEDGVPSEVAPLVLEINDLVRAQESDLERARGRAADLAHGLKTPLSALAADVRILRERGDHEIAGRIDEVSEAMRRHVERELARACIRGKRGFGAPMETKLKPLVGALISIQKRTAPGSRLVFEVDMADDQQIAMDKTDAAEVLGNLIENASRYASSTVRISALPDGQVAIDDDGQGIPQEMRTWVMTRGGRLDQRPDGAGLGLAIVQDVVAAYDRELRLDASPLGGLRAAF
jgi:signal transduction histidine kinase